MSMRPIVYGYCRFVTQHLMFIGLDGYQIGLTFVLLAILCGSAFLADGRARATASRLCPPWLYCLALIFTLFIVRLPTFLPGSMSPDESMFLAGAMKLRHHPVFWQSLDGNTSGPLNYYPLTLLNILGLPFDYATARLLNVICIGATIAIVYAIARLFMADWAARLTPLPPLAAAMAFSSTDFLHYSTECISTLLVAVATWLLLAEVTDGRASWLRGVGIGVMVALIPLAKLQAAPMAAAIAVAGMASGFFSHKVFKWRRALHIAIGLASGMTSLLFFLLVFGLVGTFQRSYIASNILYANMLPRVSLTSFLRFCMLPDFKWYEGGVLMCLLYLACTSHYLWARRNGNRKVSSKSAFFELFALLLLAVSLYAVYRPRREFPHYLMYLFFPIALVAVLAFVKLASSNQALMRTAILFVLFTLAVPCLIRGKELASGFEFETWMTTYQPNLECAACPLVSHFAAAGDPVTVWGWAPELHVLTGTVPATRESQMYWVLIPSPLQGYYRSRFLQDLRRDPPKVFIDAVAPGYFHYDNRDADGYETFPELRQYVTSNFHLEGDIHGVRIFARRDIAAK